jgi:hypothetical protein
MAVVFNGENVGIAIPSEALTLITKEITENGTYDASDESADGYSSVTVNVEPVLQEKTATENGDVTPDEGYDGLSKVVVNVASTGGLDKLNWYCTNMKRLPTFGSYKGESLDDILSGVDTSLVSDFSYIFDRTSGITSLPELNTQNGTNFKYMFNSATNLQSVFEIDFEKATSADYMFQGCSSLSYVKFKNMDKNTKAITISNMFVGADISRGVDGLDLSRTTNLGNFMKNSNIVEFVHLETSKCTGFAGAFSGCTKLKTLALDLYSASSSAFSSTLYDTSSLENLTLKNIRRTGLTIGAGATYGYRLTVDSLVNTIKELWDYSSTTSAYTLTMGNVNLAKLTGVYVKLIDVTDEMISNDPYASNKKPCVVCESTDEGAMTIIEYATSKKWTLA